MFLAMVCFLFQGVFIEAILTNIDHTGHFQRYSQIEPQLFVNEECERQRSKPPPEDEYIRELHQAAVNDSYISQIASIANRVYNLGVNVSGWELAMGWDVESDAVSCHFNDNVAIYRNPKNDKCTIVFAGTDDLADVIQDIKPYTTSWCGFNRVQAGFVTKVRNFMAGSHYHLFESYLSNKQLCGGGIVAVGHSLGGAVATLFAACANRRNESLMQGNFVVSELYTFGAPHVSKDQLVNEQSHNHCFTGNRFYNADSWFRDPIPAVAYPLGFKHPMLPAVTLRKEKSGEIVVKVDRCNSFAAMVNPKLLNSKLSDGFRHLQTEYVYRIIQYSRKILQNKTALHR